MPSIAIHILPSQNLFFYLCAIIPPSQVALALTTVVASCNDEVLRQQGAVLLRQVGPVEIEQGKGNNS